jgi:hypothetical protein
MASGVVAHCQRLGFLPTVEDELMASLNCESAIALARQRIDQFAQAAGDQFEILSDSTREINQGRLFFFNTAVFVRTGNPSFALAGNGPRLVTREGVIHELPSVIPW